MGSQQGFSSQGSIPTRPRFSWDLRNVPWTDGVGNQEEYHRSVMLWKKFHDALPDANGNKIPANLQGLMLQSQLYGRARDVCKSLSDADISSAEGAMKIVGTVFQRDPLAVVAGVFRDFSEMISMRRGPNESFQSFESRFSAQVSRFNAHSKESELPEALTAFMLLANANVDSGQKISILASASPSSVPENPTTTDYLKSITYGSISSVIKQCERPASLNPSSGIVGRRRLSPEEFLALKMRTKCHKCDMYGHWANDHKPDGSLKAGMKSNPKPEGTGSSGESPARRGATFNMVHLVPENVHVPFDNPVGPLLDDGAPYSGIGIEEFNMIQPVVIPGWKGVFDALPDSVKDRPRWQYGNGEHSSKWRNIIGSILIPARTDEGVTIYIRHLIIEGSSQWVIGRNITQYCNILRVGKNVLELPSNGGSISLKNHDLHCFVPYSIFCTTIGKESESIMFCATATMGLVKEVRPWKELKAIVDKVHAHVCGHSNLTDIRILLERNAIWNEQVEKYVGSVLEECEHCRKTALPKSSRKVSISTMSRGFNKVICVDHMYLGDHCVMHIMDTASRYSVGSVVQSTNMDEAIDVFEGTWLSQFWEPEEVAFDPGFNNDQFKSFLEKYGVLVRPLPPRRHSKNVIESKHRIIRDIYLRLKSSTEDHSTQSDKVLIYQALRISNDLYGNDVMSASELAKGYTRPVFNGKTPILVPDEIINAHQILKAKRKLTMILRSKICKQERFTPGQLVQVFIKQGKEKRGKWTGDKPVLSYNEDSRAVTVPGANGRKIVAAVEDVRAAIKKDSFAFAVQESIDELDNSIDMELNNVLQNDESFNQEKNSKSDKNKYEDESSKHDKNSNNDKNPNEDTNSGDEEPGFSNSGPTIGDIVQVYWPLDNKYYSGKVDSYNSSTGEHHVLYDDGEKEDLNFKNEVWKPSNSNDPLSANEVLLTPGTELSSVEKETVESYYDVFGSKEFLLHHAQGLPSHVTVNAYKKEEENFLKTVKKVYISNVPKDANIISSHVLYKVKILDDGSKLVKARIAPHGNKDSMKDDLKKDSAMCSPVGMRVALSICTMKRWNFAKIDFTSAFLQSGLAERDVYVVPPRESGKRVYYWLLLTAAYGLVNAGAKWQQTIDNSLAKLGFLQLAYIPQLFYMKKEDSLLSILAVKVVDDILLVGDTSDLKSVIKHIRSEYKVGTVVYGPGNMLFNGMNITCDEESTLTVDADTKIAALEPLLLDRCRRKNIEDQANAIEISGFRSVNGSIGQIGSTASPFCSFSSSILQQKIPNLKVKSIVEQVTHVRNLKKFGSMIKFKRPSEKGPFDLSIVVFSDASRGNDAGQLGYLSGLLIGPFQEGSVFHTLSWMSKKSVRPVRSIGSAEIIAAGIAIDEGKLLVKAYETLLSIKIDLRVAVDSKDLWDSLSSCHEPTDKSVKADVNVIRFEFETKNVNYMTWISGKLNLADPLTKKDSPIGKSLQLLMFSGEIPFDTNSTKTRDSSQSTG